MIWSAPGHRKSAGPVTAMHAEPSPHAVYQIRRPHKRLLLLYVLRCLLAGPFFPIIFLPALFKYETLRYRFDTEGVAMSWGFLWRREIILTYARIQDIHLARGLFERWLGLATIHIQTASGSASAEMAIVGLAEFEDVRDYFYSRMRGARVGDRDQPHGDGAADGAPGPEVVLELLTEIRDEIRSLRGRMEQGGA